ncbi:GAF domain-containing protein [Methylobacterium isbiliense]|jgi:hypothetical protein|uniref:GAF domain-containing protein n=1 Tax=Methylobacterium isbiliense TaxID=315478 RepID=A0ABQ4S5S0_9HYPH|nr:GAF domain-containing protein [Methylobacterium isbiliense]MDN3623226.1 GAF domain-containing protein [Methylobacterium isbiliense]GJD98296.1 hypothetical protein GMJLKIPL_0203 [Methylobacterium isbiliense]
MTMQSFIRAAEIWLPAPDGSELMFGDGIYGTLHAFAEHSRAMRFRKGEGLPGEAWAARHPIVMGSFKGTGFRRIEAAEAAGLTSGIAMPVFAGSAIRAVVVLLCGDDQTHVGAIEVWRNDPLEGAQIGLHDGYYGAAELFRITSQLTKFGKGHGLPGLVWASGMPLVMRELYRAERFLRHKEAVKVGLSIGLGLPFDYDPGRTWVMAFLSALGTPIARRFEIWLPDASGERLVYESGVSDAEEQPNAARPRAIARGEGLLGTVLASRLPATTQDCAAGAAWLTGEAGETVAALAFPILNADGALKAVTVWRF